MSGSYSALKGLYHLRETIGSGEQGLHVKLIKIEKTCLPDMTHPRGELAKSLKMIFPQEASQLGWKTKNQITHTMILTRRVSYLAGGFAKVKLAYHALTGDKVAIKIMEKKSLGVSSAPCMQKLKMSHLKRMKGSGNLISCLFHLAIRRCKRAPILTTQHKFSVLLWSALGRFVLKMLGTNKFLFAPVHHAPLCLAHQPFEMVLGTLDNSHSTQHALNLPFVGRTAHYLQCGGVPFYQWQTKGLVEAESKSIVSFRTTCRECVQR